MNWRPGYRLFFGATLFILLAAGPGVSQNRPDKEEEQFGPVVTSYLGYLRNEQEVVDDRVSRREISRAYYRRNSNRIRALREIAIRIARESGNDYLPELEAVAFDELGTLFSRVRHDQATPGKQSLRRDRAEWPILSCL